MLHLVINPIAGNGRAARVGNELAESMEEQGIPHTVSRTEHAGHAVELARLAAVAGADTVIAIGGDGTVSEVARGLLGTGAALAVIPAGTGNDMARLFGIPKKPDDALRFLLDRPARPLDMGRINETPFLNVCGTGFDVCVLDYALTAKRYVRGLLPYLWGVIRTIFSYRPVAPTIEVDGEAPFRRPVLLLAIANGRYIGGGMDVAPDAVPDDGQFDLITVDAMPNWRMPAQLGKLLTGRILDIPGAQHRRCRRVTMSAPGMRVNMDGEIVPMERATLEILPGALMARW